MKSTSFVLAAAFALIFSGSAQAASAGDASAGESAFKSTCGVCHSLTTNKIGPNLSGVYGRKAGAAEGFNYSPAMKSSTVVWNDDTLDQWLAGPQKFIPGQRMTLSVADEQKRANIIAYLKSLAK